MNVKEKTYYFCGKCEQDYNSYDDAEECCGGTESEDEDHGPTQAELESVGQQRLL